MKYSNYIGTAASMALIICCFLPWVYISSITTTVTGFKTENTNFGYPGSMHVFFSIFSILFFMLPKVWAKRLNVVITPLNFAWGVRNFLIVTQCAMGECPQKKIGMYAVILFSAIMLIMAMLPKMKME